jgi:hypothetical protein
MEVNFSALAIGKFTKEVQHGLELDFKEKGI